MNFTDPTVMTAAAWTSADPVLPDKVEGIESDTGRKKLGDGATHWASLAYVKDSRIEPRTTDPSSPAVGDLWLRTDLA